MTLSDLELLCEIFNDTKHHAVSLRQLSFLSRNPADNRRSKHGRPTVYRNNISTSFGGRETELFGDVIRSGLSVKSGLFCICPVWG